MGVANRLTISSKRFRHALISSGSRAAWGAWKVTKVMGGPRALVFTARIVGSVMKSVVVEATAFALPVSFGVSNQDGTSGLSGG